MAWIKWRRNRRGLLLADLRWYGPDGRERSRSLRTSDPTAAEAARLEFEAATQGRRTLDPDPTVATLLDAFYAAVAEERADATVAFYRKHLGALCATLPPTFRGWTPAAFRRAAAGQGLGPRSIQMRVNAARRLLRWAKREGYLIPDFVGDFRGRATPTRVPRALSLEERAALLAAARGEAVELPIALAALAGMRPSEWRAATWRHIRWKAKEIVVPGTKRNRERVVPAGPALLEILARHRQPEGPIVDPEIDVRARLNTLGRRIGVGPVNPYALRHTFATALVSTGADVPTIATLMGHSTPTTTYRYLHADPARLRAAIDRST